MADDRCYQRLSLHDLSFDILQRILSNQNKFALRALSRGTKSCIDNFPEHVIRLSREGSISSSAEFFSSFRGRLLIKSNYGLSGWLKSYLDAICLHKEGPEHSLQLELDEKNLSILSEHLARAADSASVNKLRNLSLSLRDSCDDIQKSFSMLSGLEKQIASIDLRLEITPRLPMTLIHSRRQSSRRTSAVHFIRRVDRQVQIKCRVIGPHYVTAHYSSCALLRDA